MNISFAVYDLDNDVTIINGYKELSKYGGELHITNTTPHITKVMKLSGIERLAVLGKAENYNEVK